MKEALYINPFYVKNSRIAFSMMLRAADISTRPDYVKVLLTCIMGDVEKFVFKSSNLHSILSRNFH